MCDEEVPLFEMMYSIYETCDKKFIFIRIVQNKIKNGNEVLIRFHFMGGRSFLEGDLFVSL